MSIKESAKEVRETAKQIKQEAEELRKELVDTIKTMRPRILSNFRPLRILRERISQRIEERTKR